MAELKTAELKMAELKTAELKTAELKLAERKPRARRRSSAAGAGPGSRRIRLAGFTLMEAVVALAILAVGLLAMLGMQLQAVRQSEWGRHTTDAGRLARDQLEVFSRLAWADPQLQDTNWTAPVPIVTTIQTPQGVLQAQIFNLQWRITTDGGNANLRQLDVRVLWTEANQPAGSPPRRYAVSSMRYND